MEPDGVSDGGRRPRRLNVHCITSSHELTSTVDMAVDAKQKVVDHTTAVTCPAVVVSHTSVTSVSKQAVFHVPLNTHGGTRTTPVATVSKVK